MARVVVAMVVVGGMVGMVGMVAVAVAMAVLVMGGNLMCTAVSKSESTAQLVMTRGALWSRRVSRCSTVL